MAAPSAASPSREEQSNFHRALAVFSTLTELSGDLRVSITLIWLARVALGPALSIDEAEQSIEDGHTRARLRSLSRYAPILSITIPGEAGRVKTCGHLQVTPNTVARRVRCDRTIPSCTRCLKAGRVCDGFGLRLSWPRRHDKKRAAFADIPADAATSVSAKSGDLSFIQTTSWDVAVHYRLSSEGWDRESTSQRTSILPARICVPLTDPRFRGRGQLRSWCAVSDTIVAGHTTSIEGLPGRPGAIL